MKHYPNSCALYTLRTFFRLLALFSALMAAKMAAPLHAADAGIITGFVSNTATGNLLEGAKIELPALGIRVLTDNTGRFVVSGVPAGTHEMVASYIGLDALRTEVIVRAGERATRDFDLTTGIYQMQEFKVAGEREGGAAAITAQRNADNVKNVVAMDSFGNLPNMSAGEVVMRLPGVAGSPTDEGLNYKFNIRGMSADLNTVTVDGALLTSLGTSRSFELQSITGTMFDQMELIKGHTPDKGADSLGGTINLKSRSPLSMKEKRRVTYSATARIAPAFTQQIPLRQAHRAHPLLTLAYQEVFDAFGGERNLGVAVNLFYSENAVGFFRTDRDFQSTTASPAYVWDYRTMDNYNNRRQASINVKTDYRLSPTTKLTLNTTVNNNNETFRRRYITRAYANQSATASTNAAIVPGFTDRITEVRATPNSRVNMTMTGPNNYNVRMRRVDFGAEHEYDQFQIDYNAAFAQTHLNNGNGNAGNLVNEVSNVGWILDRTESDLYPRFIQTAGPDITDYRNYRPSGFLTNGNTENDQEVREVRGNIKYEVPTRFPFYLKTGAHWREQAVETDSGSRRWRYVGSGPLPADPSIVTFDSVKTGRYIPQWETAAFIRGRVPVDPTLWDEDLYYGQQQKYTGRRGVTETVSAGYVMAQGRLGRTGLLTGVRMERTETESWGWVRARNPSTTAEQAADPIGAARRDYEGTMRQLSGSYTKSFPSAHLTHDFTDNLRARLSWSTSFGRPGLSNLLPNESVSETNETVTVNNPSLLPQTAKNWDATLEYYFEPVGNLSIGWFQKTIRDYIVTGIITGTIGGGLDNGFNGEYEGFTHRTSLNAGTAKVNGWEFSYQQQFTFLPGLLKGLSGSANYTILETEGDFGGTMVLQTGEVAGFIPRAANFSLSWRHGRFSTRVLLNSTGSYISSYTANSLARNLYRYSFTTVNFGLAFQLRPALSLTCDFANLFNEPQRFYRGNPDQMSSTIINGMTMTVGVSGRF